jgi:Meiotically up-regulated gene 113
MQKYVYIIGSDQPPYKVGISVNPLHRLRALQTGHPEKLHVHYQVATDAAQTKLLETVIHRHIKFHRTHGEWFDMALADLKLQVDFVMIRYADDPTLRQLLNNGLV